MTKMHEHEEQYRPLLEDVPVGFYIAERADGSDLVIECNREFAHIFGLESAASMIGRDLRTFLESPAEDQRFMATLSSAAKHGGVLLGEHLRIRTANGSLRTVEISTRPHVDDDQVIRHTGVVRDITSDTQMRELIITLSNDVGAVLHVFRQTLVLLGLSIQAVRDIFARAPSANNVKLTPDDVESQVRAPIRALAAAVDAFLHETQIEGALPLSTTDMQRLDELSRMVVGFQEIPKAHWVDFWRTAAVEILAIGDRVQLRPTPRLPHEAFIDAAQQIARITGLATMNRAREAIVAVDAPLTALRDVVTSGTTPRPPTERVPIERCVRDAIDRLVEFAAERHIRLVFDDRSTTFVAITRHDVTRAISNILHNAINYSLLRETEPSSVEITVSPLNATIVAVCVQNWGVPIPAEEISTGLVFRLGYRGRLSSVAGRVGTGVGLADALNIAQRHGGNITVTSRPAKPGADPSDYTQLFITRACLELPQDNGEQT